MRSTLFHASDLHLTWALTCTNELPGMSGEWHTRLAVEAMVHALRERLDRGDRNWHLLITGDVTDTGSKEELALAREILNPIWDPALLTVVPGNHDHASTLIATWVKTKTSLHIPMTHAGRVATFRRAFGELMRSSRGFERYRFPFVKVLRRLGFVIVGIDSTDANYAASSGAVGEAQQEQLDEVLDILNVERRYRDLGVYLALHHPPRRVQFASAKWPAGLEDGAALLRLARGRVNGVLHGHCHGTDLRWDGTDGSLAILQGPSPAFDPDEVPGRNDSSVLVRYSLHDGDIRSWADVEEVQLPLKPMFLERERTFRASYADRFRKPKACICGGPVAPEFAFCPWCSEPNETSGAGLVCHECDRSVLPGYEYCPWPWCGEEFEAEGERYDSGRMEDECEECGSGVEAYHAYCPACGEEQAEPDDDHPHACDECEWPVDMDVYLFCPWCGAAQ